MSHSKGINSKLEGVGDTGDNLQKDLELLLKLKTGQVRFNGEHFEDVP